MYGNSRTTPETNAIPYPLLQERVINNDELKLVFIAKMNNTVRSLPPFTTEDVILAAGIIERIAAIDSFIVDGIVRVDMFKSNDNSAQFQINSNFFFLLNQHRPRASKR